MKKNLFYFLSALLLTISFTSCSKEKSLDEGKTVSSSTISFKFGFPKGDPVTYATIHDTHEYGFKSLFMYEFDAAGKLLKAPIDLKASLTGAGPEYTYKHDVPSTEVGLRQFIFVANEAVPTGIVKGSTITQFREKVLSKTQSAGSSSNQITDYTSTTDYHIAMTGVAKSGNSTLIAVTGNSQVNVEMVRAVARIDVENNTPNLVITALTLNNAPATSLVLEPTALSSDHSINNVANFASLPAKFNNEEANNKLPKAFYLYEGTQANEATATSVKVVGTLGGTPVEYNIPFWKEGKSVDVRRNYIYRIVLGDATPTTPGANLEFTIETADWNTITVNDSFSAISAEYNAGAAAGYAYANSVLTVNNTAQANILFDLSNNFTGHTAYTASVKDTPSWIAASIEYSYRLKLNVQANGTGKDREAVIELKSTTSPANTYVYKLVVKQNK